MKCLKIISVIMAALVLFSSVFSLSGCRKKSNMHDSSYFENLENHDGDY